MPLDISKAKRSNEKNNEGKLNKLTKKKEETTKKKHKRIPIKKGSNRSCHRFYPSDQDKNESSRSASSYSIGMSSSKNSSNVNV